MAFRIHDVTIHLMSRDDDVAPCTMLSGGAKPCEGKTNVPPPPCQGKSEKPRPKPRPGAEERNLASLQARLRETLAPPPV